MVVQTLRNRHSNEQPPVLKSTSQKVLMITQSVPHSVFRCSILGKYNRDSHCSTHAAKDTFSYLQYYEGDCSHNAICTSQSSLYMSEYPVTFVLCNMISGGGCTMAALLCYYIVAHFIKSRTWLQKYNDIL